MLVLEENKKIGQESDRIRDNIRAKKMHDMKYGVQDDFVHPLGPKPKVHPLYMHYTLSMTCFSMDVSSYVVKFVSILSI